MRIDVTTEDTIRIYGGKDGALLVEVPARVIPDLIDALQECLKQHKGVYRYGLSTRSALSTIYEKAHAVLTRYQAGLSSMQATRKLATRKLEGGQQG